MKRLAWRAAITLVSLAAIATTGWSLYAFARHYNTPQPVAVAAVAAFDGAAYALLRLASEASAAGRSAAGARLAALGMTAASVYLNTTHARLIHGGAPAAVFFAVPTAALLLVSELAWAGPRAAARAQRGDRPFRPPAFGGWAWLLAPVLAGQGVRSRAVAHIETAGAPASPANAPAPSRHSASEVLRRRFAEMDPADAIRIAHDAQPGLTPAELAALLITYGVVVDAVQVALVLNGRSRQVEVDRADDHDAPDAHHDAPQVTALPPVTKAQAILDAAAHLGTSATAAAIVARVERINRITVDDRYVRTVLSRARQARSTSSGSGAEGIGQGGGGYA
ncbi:DUF2637 domain-containing protein [Streptomyces sp. B1866]|uniref:DUF2637 domain-containing protein n=1 Tax=Streptomyces sp. B1866 TaxID=3075431 RepID=UPI002890F8A1|nr:DUF2637 domain-containing protein [Streptomyces sp. B1866]MDT3395457.1 DUF2637 domain-containing protein [Streptomyces sp. B1866]